ncbi:MAG: hypothetical protein JW904_04775 [Spirochaetales bacterium]|nr:hypothetical protein [Spirochaetales bacterium]
MKTLIYFASKTGATAESVEKLVKLLEEHHHEVTVIRHDRKTKLPDIKKFDCILVGGSVHAGKVQKPIVKFVTSNEAVLKKKKTGLFLGCLTPTDKAVQYFDDNYPAPVVGHAVAKGLFGAGVYYDKMNFIERYILQRVTGKIGNFTAFLDENIKQFVKELE